MWNLGRLTWVQLQRPQKQRYPFLPVCVSIFVCANNGVAASVWIFIVRTDVDVDVDACNCTRELRGHWRESALKVDSGEYISFADYGIKTTSVFDWIFELSNDYKDNIFKHMQKDTVLEKESQTVTVVVFKGGCLVKIESLLTYPAYFEARFILK